jgi:putative photosynthetic complex assembly protein 2
MTMVLAAAGFALFAWWASTGLILALDRLPRWTFPWTMAGATLLTGFALAGLAWSSGATSVAAAWCAFACALVVWGWTEVSFLTGWITGPRTEASPPGTRGLERLGHAVSAIIYHELAILAGFLVVLAVCWGGENQTATMTYGVLWAMRLSAKINIFLGVPNHAEGFLPDHLAYLKSWFTRKPMNLFFPVSVSAAIVALVLVAQPAVSAQASAFEAASATLVATLLALAVLEHWFLVLPFESITLWRIGAGGSAASRTRSEPPREPQHAPAPVARPAPAIDEDKHAYSLWRR